MVARKRFSAIPVAKAGSKCTSCSPRGSLQLKQQLLLKKRLAPWRIEFLRRRVDESGQVGQLVNVTMQILHRVRKSARLWVERSELFLVL